MAEILAFRFETLQGNNLIKVCLYLEHDSFEPFNSASFQVERLLQKLWKKWYDSVPFFVKLVRTLVQIWKTTLDFRYESEGVFQSYTNVWLEVPEYF